jgi:hypothetical protein
VKPWMQWTEKQQQASAAKRRAQIEEDFREALDVAGVQAYYGIYIIEFMQGDTTGKRADALIDYLRALQENSLLLKGDE